MNTTGREPSSRVGANPFCCRFIVAAAELRPLDLTGEVGGDGGGCWCWLVPSLLLAVRAAPPSLPPENVAQSLENSIIDPPELLAAAGAVAGAGSKSQLLRVVIPCCFGYCKSGWELRFWLPSVRVEAERTL
ncbi:uncharacterized protein DS421_11g331390 [Arachis hypogaea]|nr:uncharacterized protein DS421_11g331390 [Arachis hypogaea]